MSMKNLMILLLLSGCTIIIPPHDFVYKEIQTRDFNIATWQKIKKPQQGTYKFYIEGDGYAYNSRGRPTQDPTPHGTLMRELAFGDNFPNVVYLSRPCQYKKSEICNKRHWTSARFAPEIVNAEYEVIKTIADSQPVILIGFSGGAQIAGLVSTAKHRLNVKKIITIAGNLDHESWTRYFDYDPLNESMNLSSYQDEFLKIPQIHYVGTQDKVIPPFLTRNFVKDEKKITEVIGATHNEGWEKIYDFIRKEQ